MARKSKAFLHIGPNPSGLHALHDELAEHADLLSTVDLALPPVEASLLEAAGHEMLRDHKAADLKRKDVEGAWAKVSRRAAKTKSDVVITQARFHVATGDQIELILHALGGFDVHVVITPGDDDENDIAATRAAHWSQHLPSKQVLISSLSDDAAAVDLAENLVGLALCTQKQQLDDRIAKLKKRRKIVRRKIDLLDAS